MKNQWQGPQTKTGQGARQSKSEFCNIYIYLYGIHAWSDSIKIWKQSDPSEALITTKLHNYFKLHFI
jgi:hypothetical protein